MPDRKGEEPTSTPASLLLYGAAGSGHSYKVRSLLLLTATPHRYQPIALDTPQAECPADFVAASHFGEVPVLVDGGSAYCQSNAILLHLAQRTRAFCGAAAEGSAILEWLFWETNRIGFSLTYLRARAIADLATLNETLASSEFLVPSGPSIADLACSAYLFWLPEAGLAAENSPHPAPLPAHCARSAPGRVQWAGRPPKTS